MTAVPEAYEDLFVLDDERFDTWYAAVPWSYSVKGQKYGDRTASTIKLILCYVDCCCDDGLCALCRADSGDDGLTHTCVVCLSETCALIGRVLVPQGQAEHDENLALLIACVANALLPMSVVTDTADFIDLAIRIAESFGTGIAAIHGSGFSDLAVLAHLAEDRFPIEFGLVDDSTVVDAMIAEHRAFEQIVTRLEDDQS